MPGVASLEAQAYYAHPRNAFWPILFSILGETVTDYNAKLALLKKHHIALWDVVYQCERPGSLDSNIREKTVVCNDFEGFRQRHPELVAIAFNGKASEKLFNRHVLRKSIRGKSNDTVTTRASDHWFEGKPAQLISLPSSSPAMASLTLEHKTQRWSLALRQVLDLP